MSEYPFDNASTAASTRMSSLEASFDENTADVLDRLGIAPGWRCLEVGAGGGSVARWMAGAVGPTGHVLATDIDTRLLADIASDNLEVRRHDVLTEDLPAGEFDLIHSRLVLIHHPGRDQALTKLVEALAPGGLLVLEEILPHEQVVLREPWTGAAEAFWAVQSRVLAELTARGSDTRWALSLPELYAGNGLTGIGSKRVCPAEWPGGGAGARLLAANIAELREALVDRGASASELDTFTGLLADPGFAVSSYPMMSVWGTKPGASERDH
ncbi:methyltransferase domain-containing protein [Kutzneria viridogrisea]|uniref:Methyltransferase type 11 domain-containing protein n=2 Tax=Kutzneria TaxID=43356 RepID=W5W750_9PSEU|nr:class I SAM-dependent methyltransferase [Kutzneria albida]AHH96712.1 hypothetical protein KALB_3345 [Kutzneria albida DSM 43870]MBA8928068.1 SAM-dependent methyltransferase [Kutzneria viridogrisea]